MVAAEPSKLPDFRCNLYVRCSSSSPKVELHTTQKRKRRCCQRRSGAPTRGTGPLRLALAGATRSGSAGVGRHGSRSADEATPHPSGVNWNDNLILGQRLSPIATSALLDRIQ